MRQFQASPPKVKFPSFSVIVFTSDGFLLFNNNQIFNFPDRVSWLYQFFFFAWPAMRLRSRGEAGVTWQQTLLVGLWSLYLDAPLPVSLETVGGGGVIFTV